MSTPSNLIIFPEVVIEDCVLSETAVAKLYYVRMYIVDVMLPPDLHHQCSISHSDRLMHTCTYVVYSACELNLHVAVPPEI